LIGHCGASAGDVRVRFFFLRLRTRNGCVGAVQLRFRLIGSISATNWPFFTLVLKSAYSALILPDTWLPTCTVTTALQFPVAEMLA
jgi:hypothetical protein